MNKYNIEYINKLRIHELRDFARDLGVTAPTTLKKKELLSRISAITEMQKTDNEEDGKHSDNFMDVDFFQLLTSNNPKILSCFMSNYDKSEEDDGDNKLVIKSQDANAETSYNRFGEHNYAFFIKQSESNYNSDDVYEIMGVVDIHPNGYGIVRLQGFVPSDKDVYITSHLVKKHNLKKGQIISGKAKYVIKDKPMVVFEINQIDGAVRTKKCMSFDDYTYNGLGEQLQLDKFGYQILKGERIYIANCSMDNAENFVKKLAEKNNSEVKFINVKSLPETNIFSHERLEVINIPFNKTAVEKVNTIELVFERVKREFELGKSNIVVIYNFSQLLREFNIACEGTLELNKYNIDALHRIFNILYTAKYNEKKLNTTIICIDGSVGYSRADTNYILEGEMLPLFNKIYGIEK